MRKAFFWLVQNIAEYRIPLVSKSLPVKLTIFVSFSFSKGKKDWYVLHNANLYAYLFQPVLPNVLALLSTSHSWAMGILVHLVYLGCWAFLLALKRRPVGL